MLSNIVKRFIYVICAIAFVVIAICGFVATNKTDAIANLTNYVYLYILLFIVLAVLLILFILLCKKIKNKKIIYILYFSLIFIIPILVILFISITVHEYDPKATLDFTYESLQGDYHQVFKGYYMSVYPWQFGLALYQTVVLKLVSIFNSNLIYNYSLCFNVLLYAEAIESSITLVFGLLTVKKLSNNDDSVTYAYMFLTLTCIPALMYCLYVYNDVPAICFLTISLYFFVRFIKDNKILDLVICLLFVCFAVMIRFSSLVFAIAFFCVAIFHYLFEKRNILLAILSILLIVLPILSNRVPYKYYEIASNYYEMVNEEDFRIDEGMPIQQNIAMGLDIDAYNYGWFSGSSLHTYVDICKQDPVCALDKANESISHSLNVMTNDPKRAFDFFYNKLASVWGDGTMGLFTCTKLIGETNKRSIVNFFYNGSTNIFVNCFAKAHIILVYLLSLYFVYSKRKTKELSICDFLLEIIVFGGFVLSIFWEAQSRYNLPYLYILIITASLNSKHITSKFKR